MSETLILFCEKSSVPVLPSETSNDLEIETTVSPVDVVSSETIDVIESSVFPRSRTVINPFAYLDGYVFLTNDSGENLTYREAMKLSPKSEWIEAT